jgi:hypothetical protein
MIQFLAQTGPREVTHFVIVARTNTSRMHAGQPLKITPQKQSTGMVMLAFETLEEGVHQCCTEGLIPTSQRDTLLKEIERFGMDGNKPSTETGSVVTVKLWRTRQVSEKASVNLRILAGELSITVEGQEHKEDSMLAIEEAAMKVADEQLLWQPQDTEITDAGITRESIKSIQATIPYP